MAASNNKYKITQSTVVLTSPATNLPHPLRQLSSARNVARANPINTTFTVIQKSPTDIECCGIDSQ